MNTQELFDAIQAEFKANFPEGWLIGGVWKGDDVISFDFGVIGDRDSLPSKILENDPVHHKFIIHFNGLNFQSKDLQSGICIIPPIGSFLAMSRIKTKYRKTTGDSAKVLRSFSSLFSRMKMLLIENDAIIYGRSKYENKFFDFTI